MKTIKDLEKEVEKNSVISKYSGEKQLTSTGEETLAKLQTLKDVLKMIDKMPFIMCIKDAEIDGRFDRKWREQFVIRREELKSAILGDNK